MIIKYVNIVTELRHKTVGGSEDAFAHRIRESI